MFLKFNCVWETMAGELLFELSDIVKEYCVCVCLKEKVQQTKSQSTEQRNPQEALSWKIHLYIVSVSCEIMCCSRTRSILRITCIL